MRQQQPHDDEKLAIRVGSAVGLCRLRPSWGHLGAILDGRSASLDRVGAILEPSWDHLGPSWRHLRAVLRRLGPSWAVLAILGRLGAILSRLGPSWAVLGSSWAVSRPS